MKFNRFLFYFLNFTWGILMNLIGLLGAGLMLAFGKRPNVHGGSVIFRIGRGWGGFNAGIFSFVSENASQHTLNHEFGHAVQNAWFGPFFIFLVMIPSVTRYHYRNWCEKHGRPLITKYDDIWFEGQATEWGTEMYLHW